MTRVYSGVGRWVGVCAAVLAGILLFTATAVHAVEPNPYQHTLTVSDLQPPNCALGTPGYQEGSFSVDVADGPDCTGTYTVAAQPVAGSGPGGTTPPLTEITAYIGFAAGYDFAFNGAGPGSYRVTATVTGCPAPRPEIAIEVVIPDGATGGECDTVLEDGFFGSIASQAPTTCSIFSPGFAPDGDFTIDVEDGAACDGTFTVHAEPVPDSAPDGSTPKPTTITTYIGFPQGQFFFGSASPGTYDVSIDDTSGQCGGGTNPFPVEVQVADGATGGDCDTTNPNGFVATTSDLSTPTCAMETPGFDYDGAFTIQVEDGASCTGTYTVNATPVPNSAPDGTTPALTVITTYIGFGEGNFLFSGAGAGSYDVTVNATAGCTGAQNPEMFQVAVPDGATGGVCDTIVPNGFDTTLVQATAPTCAFSSPGYARDGSFTVRTEDGAGCSGTYTVNSTPVPGTRPDGGDPSPTTITAYIGFPEGDFNFGAAEPGEYDVLANSTAGCGNDGQNPQPLSVPIPDGAIGGACDIPNPNQFQIALASNNPSACPFLSPGYDRTGNFTIDVTDGSACVGTYRIDAAPVAGSAPDGTTPPPTLITSYIGFGEGSFLFDNAGTGDYEVTVTQTAGGCAQVTNVKTLVVSVADVEAQHSVSLVDVTPSSASSTGTITVLVEEDTPACPGAYTVAAIPVPGTGYPDADPPIPNPPSFMDVAVGEFTFTQAGIGFYNIVVTETSGLMPAVNPVELEVEVPPIPQATFQVDKAFTDGNPGPVDVTLTCNTGLPLQQSFSIAPGAGVNFVVTDFANGEMDCTVKEDGVEGYTASYYDGVSTSPDGCSYAGVLGARSYSCVITNEPSPVTVDIQKLWAIDTIDPASDIDMRFELALYCDAEIIDGTPIGDQPDPCGQVQPPGVPTLVQPSDWCKVFEGDGSGQFPAQVIPEYPSSHCYVVESHYASGVEVDNGCENIAVSAGQGASCTVTNTVFFEGIPALSPRMLALLALLVLTMGGIALQRRL